MKTYEIRKKVQARSLKEALKLERGVMVEHIVLVDEQEQEIKSDNNTRYGFRW